jgi:hypothetical protein
MSDETRLLTQNYLRAPVNAFWRWTEDGQAIEWFDGETICFRAELERVLSGLEGRKLPPMGAVVLMMAACRPNWKMESVAGEPWHTRLEGCEEMKSAGQLNLTGPLVRVIFCLNEIHVMAQAERQRTGLKAAVADALFDPMGDVDVTSRAVYQQLKEGLGGIEVSETSTQMGKLVEFEEVIRFLWKVGETFAPDQVGLREKTGLDVLPEESQEAKEAVPEELPASVRVGRLMESLKADDEFGALMKVARDVVAVVQLPRPISGQDQTKMGGVSDISNRGTLDRLVLSELAHDDLTLAVRVASGEAIYLRKEFFPQTPRGSRFVLLDSGVRLWGVPRVFAAAVGLAAAATTSVRDEVRVYRASGRDVTKVDLATREGLARHLEALAPEPTPAAALRSFLALIREQEGPSEAIVVTHPDVLEDEEFQAALAELKDDKLYVATVDRGGELELLQVSAAGRLKIAGARVNLEDLFKDEQGKSRGKPLVTGDGKLPAFYSVKPMPLLLPMPMTGRHVARHDVHGTIGVSGGWMVQRPHKSRGCRVLGPRLPGGETAWVGCEDGGTARALVHTQKGMTLCSANLFDHEHNQVEIPVKGKKLRAVWEAGEVLCLHTQAGLAAYSMLTGKLICERVTSAWGSVMGRYVEEGGWYLYSHNSDGFHRDQVWPAGGHARGMVGLLNIRGQATALTTEGVLLVTDDVRSWENIKEWMKLPLLEGEKLGGIMASIWGKPEFCVAVREEKAMKWRMFSRMEGDGPWFSVECTKDWGKRWLQFIEPSAYATVHKHLSGVAVHNDELVLQSQSNKNQFAIVWDRYQRGLTIDTVEKQGAPLLKFQHFSQVKTDLVQGRVTLGRAQVGEGLEVFLDSRGLLHLKSFDETLPQMTLALSSEGILAGWMSDGSTFGNLFYFQGEATISGEQAQEMMKRLLRRSS